MSVFVVRKDSSLDHEGHPAVESIWKEKAKADEECGSLERGRMAVIDTDAWAKYENYYVEEWPLL